MGHATCPDNQFLRSGRRKEKGEGGKKKGGKDEEQRRDGRRSEGEWKEEGVKVKMDQECKEEEGRRDRLVVGEGGKKRQTGGRGRREEEIDWW